jgi:hypothetical protein
MDVVYLCYTRERHTVERADGYYVCATQLFSADCGPLFHSSPTTPLHMQTAGINIYTLEYIPTNIFNAFLNSVVNFRTRDNRLKNGNQYFIF